MNTFEDGAESGRGVGLCLGFQQKVLNANESYDSGEPGSETVSRFQKAPAREKEIKHTDEKRRNKLFADEMICKFSKHRKSKRYH